MTPYKTYFYPYIDYRAHPAFCRLDVPPRRDDARVEDMIDRVDAALTNLHQNMVSDDAAVAQAFHSGPGTEIRKLSDYLCAQPLPGRVRGWLERAFEDVCTELLTEARLRNARHSYVAELERSHNASAVCESMKDNGMYVSRADESTMRQLQHLTAGHRRLLREKAQANPSERVVENLDRYSDVGMIIHGFFKEMGIFQGLSAFIGGNTNFTGFALEYSHEKQTWWRGCYSDLGLADTRTTYMHYDHGCKYPKAMLALSEVSEENGPTCYIKGSHREQRSNFVHFMIKSLDQRFYDTYKNETGDSYYRRRFREPEHRREFLMLPRVLQACSHFGEDIADDSPLSRELLSREVRLTSDVGNCVVFDGDYGIHRGAMVASGERFSFQIIFAVEPPVPPTRVVRQRAKFLAKKLLGLNT